MPWSADFKLSHNSICPRQAATPPPIPDDRHTPATNPLGEQIPEDSVKP